MATFSVFSHSTLVGTSELEHGDPPMGVAFGRFFPVEGYARIQAQCVKNPTDQSALGLSVRTPAGDVIECAGVGILDGSADVGPEGIEVEVLGIPYPTYGELFSHHVALYDKQFK